MTLKASRTIANVAAVIVEAYAIVKAWICLTFVDVLFTIDTLVASPVASTGIIIDPIDADATVLAWVRDALVNISFTIFPSPTNFTFTFVLVICQRYANAIISTWILFT